MARRCRIDGVKWFGELDPEQEAALGAGDARFMREMLGEQFAHAIDLAAINGGDFSQVPFVAAIVHELGEGKLGQGRGRDVQPGLHAGDFSCPLAGDAPADAQTGGDGFGEPAAHHDVAVFGGALVEAAAGARARWGVNKIGVDIVFNQGDVGAARHGDEAGSVFFGHDTAERIVDRGDQYHGFDKVLVENHLQGFERRAGARMGGDFQGFDAEHFDGLKDAPVGWGFDGDGVAGQGASAYGEMNGFECAGGDDDVIGRKCAAGADVPARDLLPKAWHAGGRRVGCGEKRLRPADGIHQRMHGLGGPIRDGAVGCAQRDGSGLAEFGDQQQAQIGDGDGAGGVGWAGHSRLGDGFPPEGADIEAGLWPRLEPAAILEHAIGGDHRGDRYLELGGERADRWRAATDGEGAAIDHVDELCRNLLVKRQLGRFSVFGHWKQQYS